MLQQFNLQNENILIWVKDKLYPRNEAKVSVFDSLVQGGDAVWEGLRVYNGKIFSLDDHLTRLNESAHAMMFENIPSKKKSNTPSLKHSKQTTCVMGLTFGLRSHAEKKLPAAWIHG